MWWYRGLAGLALVAGLVACSGEEPERGKVVPVDEERTDEVAGQGSTARVGERGEQHVEASTDGTESDQAHDATPESGAEHAAAKPDIELPAELDLTLPSELDVLDGEPLQAQPERLPDLFEVAPKRRTSVSGELILGDSEEEKSFDVHRIQGGKIDVEVSLD